MAPQVWCFWRLMVILNVTETIRRATEIDVPSSCITVRLSWTLISYCLLVTSIFDRPSDDHERMAKQTMRIISFAWLGPEREELSYYQRLALHQRRRRERGHENQETDISRFFVRGRAPGYDQGSLGSDQYPPAPPPSLASSESGEDEQQNYQRIRRRYLRMAARVFIRVTRRAMRKLFLWRREN